MLEICQFFFDHGFFRWLAGLIYLVVMGSAIGGFMRFTVNLFKPKGDAR